MTSPTFPASPATAASSGGRLRSLNVATVRRLQIEGRSVMSAIGKRSVAGPRAVTAIGIAGDEQADPTVHGGIDKAVYAYPSEHYTFWEQARAEAGAAQASLLDTPLAPGALGENLTLAGLVEAEAWVGDRLVFPDCELTVSEPRRPCYKFVAVMGFATAAKVMTESARCGFYLRVSRAGTIEAGQAWTLVPGPRQVRIDEFFRVKMRGR